MTTVLTTLPRSLLSSFRYSLFFPSSVSSSFFHWHLHCKLRYSGIKLGPSHSCAHCFIHLVSLLCYFFYSFFLRSSVSSLLFHWLIHCRLRAMGIIKKLPTQLGNLDFFSVSIFFFQFFTINYQPMSTCFNGFVASSSCQFLLRSIHKLASSLSSFYITCLLSGFPS